MNVMEIMNRADPSEVARLYNENYNSEESDDGWGTTDAFNKFRALLNATVGIRECDDQFKVVVEWVDEKWGKNDEYHDQYFNVSGRKVIDPEQAWSLSMTDWGVWREMEVEDETGKGLSTNEIAAHVYYEITWFGWPHTMEEHRDNILDLTKGVKRELGID